LAQAKGGKPGHNIMLSNKNFSCAVNLFFSDKSIIHLIFTNKTYSVKAVVATS
jgi:hypothetical protein